MLVADLPRFLGELPELLRLVPARFGGGAMLFGRRTYEQFASFWQLQTDGNPFTDVLNAATKYVASRSEPKLDWTASGWARTRSRR